MTDGTVEFVSYKDIWDPATDDPGARGGIAIAIIGDDGLRYYGSHLLKIADGIEAGQHVSAGQLLGYIGESGNALRDRVASTLWHFTSNVPGGLENPPWRDRPLSLPKRLGCRNKYHAKILHTDS